MEKLEGITVSVVEVVFNRVTRVGRRGIIAMCQALPSITEVDLVGCTMAAEAIAELKRLASLKGLGYLFKNLDEDTLNVLCQFTEIESLDLTWTDLRGEMLPRFSMLKRLQRLALDGNRHIGDASIEHLANFTELRELMLDETAVSDDGVGLLAQHNKNLEVLSLYGASGVTGVGLADFAINDNLKDIDLGASGLTDEGLQQGVSKLKTLRNLYLTAANKLSKDALARLAKELPTLEVLDLKGCGQINNDWLPILAPLKDTLTELDLSRTSVNDEGLRYLVHVFTHLKLLSVCGTLVTRGAVNLATILGRGIEIEF
jgi:hypothetical protein